mmetsp:Transcript_161961/g.519315  ORF Transcript_161961/g.519315 Transcript_161961/m.519315 type:complete len:118 (+) Transcript_161961:153-506(+)
MILMSNLPVLLVAYPIDEKNPDKHFPVFHMSPGTYADAGGYSAYATLMASHGFVAIVPFVYWVPFGTMSMDSTVTYVGNSYISASLNWMCEAGLQPPQGSQDYCPLEVPDQCDPLFI